MVVGETRSEEEQAEEMAHSLCGARVWVLHVQRSDGSCMTRERVILRQKKRGKGKMKKKFFSPSSPMKKKKRGKKKQN